jgi:pimeloyl-ACP methyl ester carboxylesterase
MGAFLIRLVDEWGLDRPHVVGPDVGIAASLFAAALHPDKLRSLVVEGGATAYPLQVGGGLKQIIEAPNLEAFRTTDPRIHVGHALDAGHERYKLPGEVREDYLQSYQGDRFAESMRYVRRYPEDLPLLRERLAEIHTPVQIISGRRDGLVPPINAEDLHQRLPNSKLDILDVGYFVWEDAADQYAALIVSWIEGGYQNAGA